MKTKTKKRISFNILTKEDWDEIKQDLFNYIELYKIKKIKERMNENKQNKEVKKDKSGKSYLYEVK